MSVGMDVCGYMLGVPLAYILFTFREWYLVNTQNYV